jgi:hypothetical protein
VFLIDVDNTLLDSDKFVADFRNHLLQEIGQSDSDLYWTVFTSLRNQLGYVDYLGALQAYSIKDGRRNLDNPRVLQLAEFLLDYPFSDLVYPLAFNVITHLSNFGSTIILSDGDVVLQPRKILHSGLWDAVDGRVLIYIHKELMVDVIERRYPASHYVLIDDKPLLLHAMKAVFAQKLTTIMPRQGHYALDAASVALYPPADLIIESIGDIAGIDIRALLSH